MDKLDRIIDIKVACASPFNSPRTTAYHNSTISSHQHVGDDSDGDDSIGPLEVREVFRGPRLVIERIVFNDGLSDDADETSEASCEELSNEMRPDIDAPWPSTRADNNSPANGFHVVRPAASSQLGDGAAIRRGTGRLFATKFSPPSPTCAPGALFPVGIGRRANPHVARFIRRDDPEQMLIYADGACLNNGQPNPRAGWAFVFKPESNQPTGIVSGRLEQRGPFGDETAQTSNRAELRAVLAALRFRHWRGEGFTTIVFATDSEYVAQGATTWIQGWVRNGWKTSAGAKVKNQDLWEMLLGEIERWHDAGLKIQFWRIPRTLNVMADDAAKQAASKEEDPEEYYEVNGFLT